MDLEKLAKNAVNLGMKHLPLDAPYDVRASVELALVSAVGWIVTEIKDQLGPKEIKVKVKKGAKASATVEN